MGFHILNGTMKIYTKTGDTGETSLFTGERVLKSHSRIEAYGMVDELNSWLGLLLISIPDKEIQAILKTIQNNLFVVGADLATPELELSGVPPKNIRRISKDNTHQLELWIDQYEKELPPLKHFILPGGSENAARMHIGRCICRRTERSVVFLGSQETINREVIKYLNRLSDLLFILARIINHRNGTQESEWIPQEHNIKGGS